MTRRLIRVWKDSIQTENHKTSRILTKQKKLAIPIDKIAEIDLATRLQKDSQPRRKRRIAPDDWISRTVASAKAADKKGKEIEPARFARIGNYVWSS